MFDIVIRRFRPSVLSARERQIMGLVGKGLRARAIAEQLSIRESTVKNHLRNLYRKLGLRDRLELALYAVRHKL